MDGLLDWYWTGLAAGLGVSAAVAANWALRTATLRALGAVALGAAVAAAVVLAALVVVWAAAAFVGGLALALPSARRLSPAALPAALLACVVLALVPVTGYLESVVAPFLGARLGRRAGSRYAGLRVLARD